MEIPGAAANRLSDITSSPAWPDRWMTIPAFSAELGRQGLWDALGLAGADSPARLAFLALAFLAEGTGGMPLWACIGQQYKHQGLLTATDLLRLTHWHEARARAWDEEARHRLA